MHILSLIKRKRLLGLGLLKVQHIPKINTLSRGPEVNDPQANSVSATQEISPSSILRKCSFPYSQKAE
jgi:hypothetical protein